MPNWSEIFDDVQAHGQDPTYNTSLRKKYLTEVKEITGRNVISYYSAWLTKPNFPNIIISDNDKNALMNAVYQLDRSKGLDLILHTPGGDLAATESIIDYLNVLFKGDIRAIIPQISMSAGTIIALSCNAIMMGNQSSLGPIDPQLGGVPCQAVIDEFERAKEDVRANPASLGLWQAIISKYTPTFLDTCLNSINWASELANTLIRAVSNEDQKKVIKDKFLEHKNSYSHNRHFSKEECKAVGLNIIDMEDNQDLQNAILSLHHCYMILFETSHLTKIVENNIGSVYAHQSVPQHLIPPPNIVPQKQT